MSAAFVEMTKLGLAYPDGTRALDGVDLSISEGESVCIAGPNGAGKSTLLLCLAGLLRYEGSIRIAGRELDGRRSRARPPSVFGLVFQDPDDQLFCNTVRDDVAFGPRNEGIPSEAADRRAAEAMEAVGLFGFESRAPHHLSIGEKKRAAMAAVLACRPSVLAMDEPWAGLDARACRAVTGILARFPGTRIVVTQDLRHAGAVCERLVILDGGSVAGDGPFDELAADGSLLERHGLDFERMDAAAELWRRRR